MNSNVVGKEPGSGEGFVTMSAFVVSVVSLHVHGQSWHAGVELVTNIAVSSLVSMDLSVSGKVAAAGKLFTTILAALHLLTVDGAFKTVAAVL